MRTLVSALSKSDTSWYEAGQLCRIEPWPWKPSIQAFPVLMVWFFDWRKPYDIVLKLPSLGFQLPTVFCLPVRTSPFLIWREIPTANFS